MSHTLITFLGRVPEDREQGGYRAADYRFPDGSVRTESFSGLALEDWAAPDRVVALGTTGSMWHVLLELTGRYEDTADLWDRLDRDHRADAVAGDDLAALGAELGAARGRPWQPRLIPYGADATEQVAILRTLAEEVPEGGRVTLDVTHGLRHLPMLALVSALYLRTLKGADLAGFYYGALDMAAGGEAPVVSLDGLLAITDWLQALQTFDKDGDYGVFYPLYRTEGVPGGAASLLRDAAFHERTTNTEQGYRALRAFHEQAPALDTPIGGLFADALTERLRWHEGESRAERERALAYRYWSNGDYLRAVIFALEAYVSSLTERRGWDVHDYQDREEARNRKKSRNFQRLKSLRNSMAHGTESEDGEVRDALQSRAKLERFLQPTIHALLEEDWHQERAAP